MKKRIILVLSLLVLTVLIPSCVITSHDYHVEISCDTFMENPKSMLNNFQMEIGDKLYVKLCSNPSTGFEWSYQMSGDAVIKEEDHDFEEAGSDALGAAGQEMWTFEAVKKGKTVINMEYSQPWEGGLKGEWTYKIDVTVE